MTGSQSSPRSRTPSPTGSPDIRALQQKVDDLFEYLQSHAFPLNKLQHDFVELKLKVDPPTDELKNNKLDERNIKLDDFTGQGSPEDYLD